MGIISASIRRINRVGSSIDNSNRFIFRNPVSRFILDIGGGAIRTVKDSDTIASFLTDQADKAIRPRAKKKIDDVKKRVADDDDKKEEEQNQDKEE